MTSYKLKHPENLFEKYFNQILLQEKMKLVETGPYISISREFGCMANDIAKKLARELSKRTKGPIKEMKWKWINKSILEESSKVLELSPSKIEYVFRSKAKTMMDEIVSAMATRYYKSDKKIRKTIVDVIRAIAKTGHIIIVGRGGVAFASDNARSLHIKLVAPKEWRVERIAKNHKMTKKDAMAYINEIDMERKYLIDTFMGYETGNSIFDIVLNRKSLSEKEILSTIINLLEMKKLIGQ
ncbi:MAG: cytidylate kinase-like family protein [Chlorobi bacterium]|nr:cytidylate kinase-like family protein [Chlorobiota bacterium]